MIVFAHNQIEKSLWSQNKVYIVGIDEVGMGAWAGPLVVGAVIFPVNFTPSFKLADSKQLTAKKRATLVPLIQSTALSYAVVEVVVEEINQHGLAASVQIGYQRAIKALHTPPDFLLIDALKLKSWPADKQQGIIKGDQQSISIAAASILAKQYRDQLMRNLHTLEPRYAFKTNVGYGTKAHRDAIALHGLSQYHRMGYDLTKWFQK
jgi:ribonuclease HII